MHRQMVRLQEGKGEARNTGVTVKIQEYIHSRGRTVTVAEYNAMGERTKTTVCKTKHLNIQIFS